MIEMNEWMLAFEEGVHQILLRQSNEKENDDGMKKSFLGVSFLSQGALFKYTLRSHYCRNDCVGIYFSHVGQLGPLIYENNKWEIYAGITE
jgi:hypothetical protein